MDESVESFEKSIWKQWSSLWICKASCLLYEEGGLKYIQKAADNNCIRAMYQYAYYLLRTNDQKNEQKGIEYLKIAAEKGH